ncbi:ATP-grasp ribosomal peptide maturase [Kitasatospora sp. GP30]|uniref:ATP-grasp ribosomal peptide maturase n=1 Tax=Kitasatospora sp. GP30 TaxID=3035084 RepID=UPI000C712652|nr:ATP-grasp ribosomal peptide maturase [Kitasatospora sp. GP30]MDH6138029.1 ATP-grasp ribosomal peptide maturase [Kitasatospora sp. GP30]
MTGERQRAVLVLTSPYDATADLVLRILADRRVPLVRTDPSADLHQGAALTACYTSGGRRGTLTTASRTLDLDRVRSVWYRRPSNWQAPDGMEGQDAAFARSQAQWGVGGILGALPGAHYVNHPWRIRDAEHKPAQLDAALATGFAVPDTIVTSDPAQARRFCADQRGGAVYKPLWNSPYAKDSGAAQAWVAPVAPGEITDAVSACPHLFQARVDKDFDVRLTAVGAELFAVRIDSPDLDWRRRQHLLAYTPIDVPPPVRRSVARYLERFQLVYGAFDFAVDQTGRWWFFECNSNGQWAFFPPPTTDAIATAIADQLEKGPAA